MKNILLYLATLFFVVLFSCQNAPSTQSETNPDTTFKIGSAEITLHAKEIIDTIAKNDDVVLNEIDSLDESREQNPTYINWRIKQMTKNVVNKWSKEAGFDTLPDYILFRVFKHEHQFEIWGRNGNKGKLKRIKIINVPALEIMPGPKLKQWDLNTAEGFYTYGIYYTSPSWYMFVKLTNNGIKKTGNHTYGSCFKMFINYPNAYDRQNSKLVYGNNVKNGTICIHGNCVTACCVSFYNEMWVTVFAFGLLHNKKYGAPHIYMFPCRFSDTDVKDLFLNSSCRYAEKDSVVLYPFWENIKKGYYKFEKEHKPLKFKATKEGYLFY